MYLCIPSQLRTGKIAGKRRKSESNPWVEDNGKFRPRKLEAPRSHKLLPIGARLGLRRQAQRDTAFARPTVLCHSNGFRPLESAVVASLCRRSPKPGGKEQGLEKTRQNTRIMCRQRCQCTPSSALRNWLTVFEGQFGDAGFVQFAQTGGNHSHILFPGGSGNREVQALFPGQFERDAGIFGSMGGGE